jgi:hypothetical protein
MLVLSEETKLTLELSEVLLCGKVDYHLSKVLLESVISSFLLT